MGMGGYTNLCFLQEKMATKMYMNYAKLLSRSAQRKK